MFGDLSMKKAIEGKPPLRAARIVTTSECHFATLNLTQYMDCLSVYNSALEAEEIEFFLSIPFFKHLSKTQIKKIRASINVVHTIKGQTVVTEGSSNEDIYIIREGEFTGS
jgi:hypothetical protein